MERREGKRRDAVNRAGETEREKEMTIASKRKKDRVREKGGRGG